ncbi:YtjB family periplasmic protein [Photobacterium sp. TY1-4]|uniref:YtjB family periplasmic protein n=1 Tax=Photobacterium sp. TY1-4 TaxID=2899122 RepID=UPI0021BE954E|nr:YtjB family periplasmic protein [Photobacterium sp. TY1-4]UXI00790.1 YtjB family periplasmic protein [Photobacterium sp. TY1-4]
MMILKKMRLRRFWQVLVLAASLGGLVAMLEYGADLNLRNYRALSEQTQTLSRMVVRQAAATAAQDMLDKDQNKLQALVQRLSEEPLILDASIYDLEGVTVAQTEEAMPLEQVTGMSTPLSVASFGRQQVVEPIMTEDQVVGFVRITLEQGRLLEKAASQVDYMTNTIRALILAGLMIGFLLAYTFGRRKDIWHFPFLLTSNKQD